jgi:solute carrier family 9 (sodium/hydrogen exchanger), member 6/7
LLLFRLKYFKPPIIINRYMKPLLTHSRPTLLETLPVCLSPVARLLTTTEQMTQDGVTRHRNDSDSDMHDDINSPSGGDGGLGGGVRRNSMNRVSIHLVSDDRNTILYKNRD